MKLTKPLIIAALIAGNFVAWDFVRAQDSTTTNAPATQARPGMRARPGFGQAVSQLNLTDDQKPKVQAVLDDMQKQLGDIQKDTSLSKEDRRTKMQDIRKNTNNQLKAILTPDQFQKWQSLTQRPRHAAPPAANSSTNAAPQQ